MGASAVCRIVADVYEPRDGVIAALGRLGVHVELRRLQAGDYELPEGVVVERKTVCDLHQSVRAGRLWRQVRELRRASRVPYLMIEGGDLDRGPLSPPAVRGACLAVLGQGVGLLRTDDSADSALWLQLLATRQQPFRPRRDRPRYAQILQPRDEQVPEAMLAAVPGVSVTSARLLLERFGTVSGVVAAGHDAWLTVPGIGPRRASELHEALTRNHSRR